MKTLNLTQEQFDSLIETGAAAGGVAIDAVAPHDKSVFRVVGAAAGKSYANDGKFIYCRAAHDETLFRAIPDVGASEAGKINDPKFIIIDNVLCSSTTHLPIPTDEPLFIIRGKDKHATGAIYDYSKRCNDKDHKATVLARNVDFSHFSVNNSNRMKEPDSIGIDTFGPKRKK